MGLDPMSAITGSLLGIATNLATDILKHYAQKLDGTLAGRGLKQIGLIETTRDDHLRKILEETLQLYFKKHPGYDISRESRYFGYLLRNKSATGRADGKREPTAIGQTRRCLVDSFTEDRQISIEGTVVEWTQFDPYHLSVLCNRTRKLKKGQQTFPGGLRIEWREIVVTHPHRQIR